jgi:hypothetical protein
MPSYINNETPVELTEADLCLILGACRKAHRAQRSPDNGGLPMNANQTFPKPIMARKQIGPQIDTQHASPAAMGEVSQHVLRAIEGGYDSPVFGGIGGNFLAQPGSDGRKGCAHGR